MFNLANQIDPAESQGKVSPDNNRVGIQQEQNDLLSSFRKLGKRLAGILTMFWLFTAVAGACEICSTSPPAPMPADTMVMTHDCCDHQPPDCCDSVTMDDMGDCTLSDVVNSSAKQPALVIHALAVTTIHWPSRHQEPLLLTAAPPPISPPYLANCRFLI